MPEGGGHLGLGRLSVLACRPTPMMTLYTGPRRKATNSNTDSAKLLISGGKISVIRAARGPVAPFAKSAPSATQTSISAYLQHMQQLLVLPCVILSRALTCRAVLTACMRLRVQPKD